MTSKVLITSAFVFLVQLLGLSQTFTHSGAIRTEGNIGVPGVTVNLYKRVTPVITGFTNQQNYNGHSYYRSTGSAFWSAAKAACDNMGGHLVTVTTQAENNFIFGLWPSGWIGLTDEVNEGVWRWVTGEAYSYTSWNPGEPNNAGNEDYVQFVGNGKWNDLPNNVNLPYVLEFEYIVTTTAWTIQATSVTNLNGQYSFSQPTNPSVEWYIEVVVPTVTSNLTSADFEGVGDVVTQKVTLRPFHYHKYDLNLEGKITTADICIIADRINGAPFTKSTLLFTNAQWTSLNSGSSNLMGSIPGLQSNFTFTPTSGGISNFYLLSPGYSNQATLQY